MAWYKSTRFVNKRRNWSCPCVIWILSQKTGEKFFALPASLCIDFNSSFLLKYPIWVSESYMAIPHCIAMRYFLFRLIDLLLFRCVVVTLLYVTITLMSICIKMNLNTITCGQKVSTYTCYVIHRYMIFYPSTHKFEKQVAWFYHVSRWTRCT